MKLRCKECGEVSFRKEWDDTEVGCEDCGSHPAIRCPKCGDDIDTIYLRPDETEMQVPMRFYIATRLENVARYNQLRDALVGLGHELTYDWTSHGGSVRGQGHDVMKNVSGLESVGVVEADVLIVLLPGGRGTHVELGVALRNPNNSDVFLWSEDPAAFDHASELTCAFYHDDAVTGTFSGDFDTFMSELIARIEDKYGVIDHTH